MRLTGTLRSWNDDRGFGFIAPAHGGTEIFVHISAFAGDGSRPTVGETLTYELGRSDKGKPQAINVQRQAFVGVGRGQPRPARQPQPRRRRSVLAPLAGLAVVTALVGYGYDRYAQHAATGMADSPQVPPAESVDAPKSAANALSSRCDGRTHCSQMTSCAEAKFFLQNCPGAQMDGNRDGVPCEQQWCTGLFAE
jgi:cold shock CspA family protein